MSGTQVPLLCNALNCKEEDIRDVFVSLLSDVFTGRVIWSEHSRNLPKIKDGSMYKLSYHFYVCVVKTTTPELRKLAESINEQHPHPTKTNGASLAHINQQYTPINIHLKRAPDVKGGRGECLMGERERNRHDV